MAESALADRATIALENNPHLPRRKLSLEARQGHVTLRGTVTTYFQKQMAQEALRRIEGVEQVDNQLEVHWS